MGTKRLFIAAMWVGLVSGNGLPMEAQEAVSPPQPVGTSRSLEPPSTQAAQPGYVFHDIATRRSLFEYSDVSEFGRFEAFHLQMMRGEESLIIAQSSAFKVRLIAVSPSGMVYQGDANRQGVARLDLRPDETGRWQLGVFGPTGAEGAFEIRFRRVIPRAEGVNKDTDLCASLFYIASHSQLNWSLLAGDAVPGKPSLRTAHHSPPKMSGAVITAGGDYRVTLYRGKVQGTADQTYETLASELEACLNSGWQKLVRPWSTRGASSRPWTQRSVTFTGDTLRRPTVVTLEQAGPAADGKSQTPHVVQLIVYKMRKDR